MSETAKHREKFLPFIPAIDVLDLGFGGEPIVPWAVCCDLPGGSYGAVGTAPQHLGVDCRHLPFKDGTLNSVYSSHLLEDFIYSEQVEILTEWKRCLRSKGIIALLQPDQQRFEAHCAATGQGLNLNHKEADYSLATFKSRVWNQIRGDMALVKACDLDDYSWMFVMQKL